ncbi:MAG: metallopeptidase family protein [Eggerthellaceae bacterium]|nr:metallopeptidase family protein [Eggerthellaceae bacterium]
MVELTDEEFEAAVQDAIDTIPEEFLDELDNVAILLADEPEEPDFEGDGYYTESGDLLGLYDGIALTERGDWYGAGNDYPDTITIFKGPHERLSDDREVVLDEIRKTVIHETAHYFGMDEDQVDEMGYA